MLKKPKYDWYQGRLAGMIFNLFDTKTGFGAIVNEKLAQELQKSEIKTSKRRKVYSRFKNNIWAADLPEVASLSSFNWGLNIY